MSRLNKVFKRKEHTNVLPVAKEDRRLLANVPDSQGQRSNVDRRGQEAAAMAEATTESTAEAAEAPKDDFRGRILKNRAGIRYRAGGQVRIFCRLADGRKKEIRAESVDISATGLLVSLPDQATGELLQNAGQLLLKFRIAAGAMPEGYEMRVKLAAKVVRLFQDSEGGFYCGLIFAQDLNKYADNHKNRNALAVSSLLLFFVVGFILLMRAESVIYFKFNKYLYLYSIVTALFLLSRYLFGAFYRPTPINPDFTPGVSIIIPCFNEEQWIQRTIVSCVNQDYPMDKLEVIVVDDCSNDQSVAKIKDIIGQLHREGAHYNTAQRVRYFVQPQNLGKRHALSRGTLAARHELVVFVDSDSFLDPYAIRNLVMPFQDPKMAGVAGRTDVANTYTNILTKMQSVRYYISFRIMKAAESVFDVVTCLSGPLACYRKEIVIEHMDQWLNQKFLGRKATFGDDRSMTNFVLNKHRTGYQDTAICSTIAPNRYKVFLRQQMRWKRSWLRESIIAGRFMWRKEPFAALVFYLGLLVPVAAPVVVFYNMLYVPLVYRVFPTTFLVGMLMMALLMSIVQLFLKKSSTWLFGMVFCIFYEAVLLWQMPVAWFTFWKSTWGTRLTPEDIAEQQQKKQRLGWRKKAVPPQQGKEAGKDQEEQTISA